MIAGLDLETVLHGGDCRPDKGDMDGQHCPGVPGKELRGATGGGDQISRHRESYRRAALAALFPAVPAAYFSTPPANPEAPFDDAGSAAGAAPGAVAADAVAAGAVAVDVVLTDGDGIETLDRVRARYPALPVIVLSAQNTLDTAVRASDIGAYEYFPKPFDIDELARAVRAAGPELILLAPALSALVQAGREAGLAVVEEIFADRQQRSRRTTCALGRGAGADPDRGSAGGGSPQPAAGGGAGVSRQRQGSVRRDLR